MSETSQEAPSEPTKKWQPLDRVERRLVGVLIEKAKTTPDNYPLTLNSLINGSNQKSNRAPQMSLDEEHVYDPLEHLRKLGAIAEVQGDGRVPKFRHLMYDWLGVDKVELAVMAELLLRGAQSVGELRGRAARMEKIPGMTELRPVLDSLHRKGLIVYLTPPGRGCVVTHALYREEELEKIRKEFGSEGFDVPVVTEPLYDDEPAASSSHSRSDELESLREEVADLRAEVEQLRAEFEELKG